MRRMSRRVGFSVPIVALAFFLTGCPKRDATPAMSTSAAPASSEPAPTSPEPAPAAPVATPPKEFRAHEGLMDVHFAPGKSEVLKGDAAALDSTAAWLKQNLAWLILIEGYTDDRGTKDQNLAVSERRARSVMSYLITKGVEPDRISIASYGADRPLCREKNEGCRAKNRRVHFLVRER